MCCCSSSSESLSHRDACLQIQRAVVGVRDQERVVVRREYLPARRVSNAVQNWFARETQRLALSLSTDKECLLTLRARKKGPLHHRVRSPKARVRPARVHVLLAFPSGDQLATPLAVGCQRVALDRPAKKARARLFKAGLVFFSRERSVFSVLLFA